jgi:aminoglycoside phosphotransferase (APT) family kinase protein
MPEWDPEADVGADAARALIEAQFPELRGTSLREIDAGWDNVVYLVDERWAFRFPRRAIAVAGVEREIEVLGRLAPQLPIPIPTPAWIGAPTDAYPWPWFGAPYLPGRELALSGLPDEHRADAAAAVGTFLRVLHAPRLARLVGTALPVDPLRRADMGLRVKFARSRVDAASRADGRPPPAGLERLFADAERLPPPSTTRVVHGDLHPRHVLVDPQGRVTGIIDWGDVCSGDPSLDLSIAYGSFVGPARAAFVEAYGPIGGLAELRARVIAAFLAAALLSYAIDRGLPALRAESRRALERVVA